MSPMTTLPPAQSSSSFALSITSSRSNISIRKALANVGCSSHNLFFICASQPITFDVPAESEQPASSYIHQKQSFLDVLASELKKKQPRDKPSDPVARALTLTLSDIEEVSQVDAFLDGFTLSAHAFSTLFQKLGFQKKATAILCVYHWLRGRPSPKERPNVYIYSSILSALKACGDFEHFNIVLSEMQQDGIEPNLVTYNIMINANELQGLHSEALVVFHRLLQSGLIPNRGTFRALLRGFENPVNMRGALMMHSSIKEMLLDIGMETVTAVLKDSVSSFCCGIICQSLRASKGSDFVLWLIEIVEASLSELRAVDYEEIVWTCGSQEKDYLVAKYALGRRRNCHPIMSAPLCNHAMQIMRKEKKWWAALEVFEHMVEQGPPPDADSYTLIRSQFNFLLNASKDRGTSRWNVQLLQKMVSHSITPDKYAWESTLLACVKKVDPVSAVFVFKKMIEEGHQPSLLCYGALLTTLERSRLFVEVEKVWVHMQKMKVKPNIKICTIMLAVYGSLERENEVKKLLDMMNTWGIHLNLITYNTLITNSAKFGDCSGALHWMKQLTTDGFEPDAVSYSQLVIALSRGGQADVAKDMCVAAKNLQVVLSQLAYRCVIEACETHNVECNLDAIGGISHIGSVSNHPPEFSFEAMEEGPVFVELDAEKL